MKPFLSEPYKFGLHKETRHWNTHLEKNTIAHTEPNFWDYYKNKQLIMGKLSYGN